MRKGFTLITAIMFIVLVSTLGALALTLSAVSTKQTTDLYLRAQAELLAKSATEFALLAISGHEINATNGCLNQINSQYVPNGGTALFDINVTINYLGNGLNTASGNNCNLLDDNISTADSNVTVMIDTFVETVAGITTEPIRFHRRTLQKP